MQNSLLIKGFRAAEDLAAHQIVALNDSGHALSATSKSALAIGVTAELSTSTDGIADVIVQGIAEVNLSSIVTAGTALTAADNGTAATASAPCRVIGIALKSGLSGDRIPMLLAQSQLNEF